MDEGIVKIPRAFVAGLGERFLERHGAAVAIIVKHMAGGVGIGNADAVDEFAGRADIEVAAGVDGQIHARRREGHFKVGVSIIRAEVTSIDHSKRGISIHNRPHRCFHLTKTRIKTHLVP